MGNDPAPQLFDLSKDPGEQTNLAVSLRSAGRAVDAADLLDRAYQRLFEDLGERRPETLACRLSRAVNLLALDRNDSAFEELVHVHDVYQESLGPNHPHTIACVTNLAAVARARGQRDAAVDLARAAAADFGQVLGSDHPYTLAALTNLAVCSADVGDLTTAAAVVDDLTPRAVRVLGDRHPDALRCRANHVLIDRLVGHGGPDVTRVQETVFRTLTDLLGESHPTVEAFHRGDLLHRTIDRTRSSGVRPRRPGCRGSAGRTWRACSHRRR